jgi:very-short-patch-repair endonuclease
MLKPFRPLTSARKNLLATRARDMRLHAQEPERALWRELRGGQLGVAFRRQVVLGNRYIADFVAPSLRLVVEVDGAGHALQRAADARRDRNLARLGYQVLRIPAEVVMRERALAVALVQQALSVLRADGTHPIRRRLTEHRRLRASVRGKKLPRRCS